MGNRKFFLFMIISSFCMLILGLFSYVFASQNVYYTIDGTIDYTVPVLYNGDGSISSNLTKYIATQITGNSDSYANILKTIDFVTDLTGVDTTNAINVGYESTTTTNDNYVAYWSQDTTDTTKYNVSIYSSIGKFVLPENSAYMFRYCRGLTNLDLSNFDTSNATSMFSMFSSCSSLTTLDLSSFDTFKVTNMYRMFYACQNLITLDISSFNTSKVTDMAGMFSNCLKLASLDISSFDTSKVTNMQNMFRGCKSLTTLDINSFNTSSVTDMQYMFYSCYGLTTLDLSNFNTSNVENMCGMFFGCYGLTTLDLSNFNTSSVTSMSSMFASCGSLTTLDLSNFNTSSMTSMDSIFAKCSGLTNLDLSSFDTSRVTSMSSMFSDCSSLTTLDLMNFNTSNVTYYPDIFTNCTSLLTINTPKTNALTDIALPATFVDNSGTSHSTLPTTNETSDVLYKAFTVTFDPQNGTVDPTSKLVGYSLTYGDLPTPTKSGYNFAGWNTASDGSGTTISSTSTVSITTDTTLYAVWKAYVTIGLEAGDGVFGSSVESQGWTISGEQYYGDRQYDYSYIYKSVEKGCAIGTLPTPSRTGYKFVSWNTASDGSGATITSESTLNSSTVIYAMWEIKTFTITIENNTSLAVTNDSGHVTQIEAKYGQVLSLGDWKAGMYQSATRQVLLDGEQIFTVGGYSVTLGNATITWSYSDNTVTSDGTIYINYKQTE